MKKLGLTCIAGILLAWTGIAFGQYGANFVGNIHNGSNGMPVANLPVTATITYDANNLLTGTSVMANTDAQGLYSITMSNLQYMGYYDIQITGADPCGVAFSYSWNVDSLISFNTYTRNFISCACQMPTISVLLDTANNMQNAYFSTNFANHPNYSILWHFGDGTTSNQPSPAHTYNSPGTYQVCALVFDNITGCVDSTCITVNASCSQVNGLWQYHTTNGLTLDIYSSTQSNFQTVPTWDLGDGTTVTQNTVSHTYALAGTYQVQGTAMLGVCPISANFSVTVPYSPPPPTSNVYGSVYKSPGLVADEIVVYLILHDPNNQTLTLIDSVWSDSGTYSFLNIAAGSYLVKSALRPVNTDYLTYLPTYHNSSLYWSGAQSVITPVFGGTLVADIQLSAGVNPGGPGFIGGSILQGANLVDNGNGNNGSEDPQDPYSTETVGDPVPGVYVLLLDLSGNPVAWARTDVNGEFSISNLAYGTYQVFPEVHGMNTTPVYITLDAGQPSVNDITFALNSTTILEILEAELLSSVSIYPNPATDVLTLDLVSNQFKSGILEIQDINGRTVLSRTISSEDLQQKIQIPLTRLTGGSYVISITTPEGTVAYRNKFTVVK